MIVDTLVKKRTLMNRSRSIQDWCSNRDEILDEHRHYLYEVQALIHEAMKKKSEEEQE